MKPINNVLRVVDEYSKWLSHEFPEVGRVLDNLHAELSGEGLNAGTPGTADNCVISSLREQLRRNRAALAAPSTPAAKEAPEWEDPFKYSTEEIANKQGFQPAATQAQASAPEALSEPIDKYVALGEKCGAEVGRYEGAMVWMKFHSPSAVESFAARIVMLAALKPALAAPSTPTAAAAPDHIAGTDKMVAADLSDAEIDALFLQFAEANERGAMWIRTYVEGFRHLARAILAANKGQP